MGHVKRQFCENHNIVRFLIEIIKKIDVKYTFRNKHNNNIVLNNTWSFLND